MAQTHPDDLVTVAHYSEPAEAQVAQSVLDGAGIESFLAGAEANSLLPPVTGARLQVAIHDEEVARALLTNTAELAPEGAVLADNGNDL